MDKEELIIYAIRTSEAIKEEKKQELIDYASNLQQKNQKYKEVIDKAINDLNIIIDIVRELPLGSDCWIIDRLEANKSILKE